MNPSSAKVIAAMAKVGGIKPPKLLASLNIKGTGNPPSFKNTKRAIRDRRTGKMRTLTPGKIKKRMDALENAIWSQLYFCSMTTGNETHSECLKRLRTALSGLSDDSVREIPAGAWEAHHVPKGEAEIRIQIFEL